MTAPVDLDHLTTMTYEVADRVARITHGFREAVGRRDESRGDAGRRNSDV